MNKSASDWGAHEMLKTPFQQWLAVQTLGRNAGRDIVFVYA